MKNSILIKILLCLCCVFFIGIACTSFISKEKKPSKDTSKQDSIALWIKASKNKKLTSSQQKKQLVKAYLKLQSTTKDILHAKNLSNIAYQYLELKDATVFHKINNETLQLALQLKDSFAIADAHWSYANYYYHNKNYEKSYFHYNIAYNHFEGIQRDFETAKMLYQMSFIKGIYRDYTGSEVLIIEAIKKFKALKNYEQLYFSYNFLGGLQKDIQEYDKALFYEEKALAYLDRFENKKNYRSSIFNNIGNTYRYKKNYTKAIEYYNKALSKKNRPDQLARTTNNKAYCKLMLHDTLGIQQELFRALRIRDSIADKTNILSSKIFISRYYEYAKKIPLAFKYAQEANIMAKKLKNGSNYLETLQQMANLDPKNAKQYLERYIQYNDSLIGVERRVQNKFTRIEFETDEHITENKLLEQQKNWIYLGSFGMLLIISLLYFLKVQKSKNEKLLLETAQQKATEEIYLLTLEQQAILEEKKVQERNRISQELHDGILGKLFGTRINLGFLEITKNKKVQEQHQYYLEELQDIEKEIRDVSHQLNTDTTNTDINFTNLIAQLLQDKSILGNFKYKLTLSEQISWKTVNELVKVNLYRIIQESLQNIIKHANASQVLLAFSKEQEHLVVELTDNGIGFNSNKTTKGIGLKNAHSRIQKLNGKFHLSSVKNQGTSIHIQLPITITI